MDKSVVVSVAQYVHFREQGFLVVRGLVGPREVRELLDHVDDLRADGDLLRIHMLHRRLEIHERFMLHPGVLDVVAALVGPWVALDRADTENGCVWITAGSQHEPVYPDADEQAGHGGDFLLADIPSITGADDPDESRNGLTPVARRYAGREVAAVLDPGDVVFFGGHVLHRSHANRSPTRCRRAFVAHYCNARSSVPWDDDPLPDGEPANDRHILARGTTDLPYAKPRFAR